MATITKRHQRVTAKDRTGTPITCVLVDQEVGDFKASNLQEGDVEVTAVLARGRFQGLEQIDDAVISGSITYNVKRESFTHATESRILDLVNKTGKFAAGVTANPGDSAVWCVDLLYEVVNGETVVASMLYECCRLVASYDTSDTVTLAITFSCYDGVTYA